MKSHLFRAMAGLVLGAAALALDVGFSGAPGGIASAQAQTTNASRTSIYPLRFGTQSVMVAEVDALDGHIPQGQVTFSNVATTPAQAFGTAQLSSVGAGQGTIAAGANHVCYISTQLKVWCLGSNEFGQLGNGTNTSWTVLTVVKSGGADLVGAVSLVAGAKASAGRAKNAAKLAAAMPVAMRRAVTPDFSEASASRKDLMNSLPV